jgi:peptidoglycan hydrolase-like protein with peptidoglycan-binding domain
MNKLMIALLASAAMASPAFAQANKYPPSPPTQAQPVPQQSPSMRQPDMGQQTNPNGADQYRQGMIAPQTLDRSQVMRLQEALNQKGYDVGQVDGVWGPNTEAALGKFQSEQGLQGQGQLDHKTLSALGLNAADFAREGQGPNNKVAPGAPPSQMNQPGTTNPGAAPNEGMQRQDRGAGPAPQQHNPGVGQGHGPTR